MATDIAVITKNRTNPAYVGARRGVDRVAARLGAATRHFVPETPDDVDEQIALLREAVAARPAAILLAPAHPTKMADALSEAGAAGIPLFFFVSETVPSPAVTFVGSDDERLGELIARRLAETIGGAGRVALVEGHPNAATTAPRIRGIDAALAGFPGIEVVARIRGDYQEDVARARFREALPGLPALDGVIAMNDFMAFGILDVLSEAGRRVPAIGANATPRGIALVREGRLVASAAFDAMSMGAVALEAALRHLAGEPVPRRILLPTFLVDADNAADLDRPYEERPVLTLEESLAFVADAP